jgi:dGTPase
MGSENWISLLKNSRKRLGKNSSDSDPKIRSDFQRDFDRIVFSSAFRRLQNKTQVLPLPKSDYVRNRLTHSLETASVGRSLGNIAGTKIIEKYPEIKENLQITSFDFGYMVSAACLAHDIGNPPFGHSGETAINLYFKSPEAKSYLKNLNDKEIANLQDFEGNSAGFRILAKTLKTQSSIPGGLRLTYGTYATFTKYPKEVLPYRKKEGMASMKKYGIFQSELEYFKEIASELNLKPHANKAGDYAWRRFPLAFLVEAADDICYRIIDFEDGFNIDLISYDQVYNLFTRILETSDQDYQSKLAQIKDERSKTTYLRSLVINELINRVADIFYENEENILQGAFDKPLLDCLDNKTLDALDEIKKLSVSKIYRSSTVLKIESAGFRVIPFLLETFIKASLTNEKYEGKTHIIDLLPNQYKSEESDYEKILNITMFIASMTDRFAVELYKNLNGIELAGY